MMITPQMDLKTFAGNEFDPKKWINKAWSSSGHQEKEVFVANAVSRLQLYMKQLTNSLDETTTQIVTSLPRVIQEGSAFQKDGQALQEELIALEQKVQAVEAQTGSSIESLQRIDKLKSRLENAATTLQEADKWAALTKSLEELLDKGVPTQGEPLKELAEQVTTMTKSLETLSSAPEYDRRCLQLATLYNRLEAAADAPLAHAITHNDSERAAAWVSVLAGMRRGAAGERCWRGAAGAGLACAWARLPPPHSLPALTRLLRPAAADQLNWLTNVLKSERPLTELARLYTDLLLSVEPSPAKIASAALQRAATPALRLQVLLDLRRDCDHFRTTIHTFIATHSPNNEAVDRSATLSLGRAAYAPLRSLLPALADLQGQLLLAHLDDLVLDQEMLERARALSALAERSADWSASARACALAVAGRAALPHHARALQTFVKAFASHIAEGARRVEAAVSGGAGGVANAGGVLSAAFPSALALHAAATALLALAAPREDDLHDQVIEDKFLSPLEDVDALLEDEPKGAGGGAWAGGGARAEGVAALRRTSEHLQLLARSILRQPIDAQLDKIAQLPVWNDNDALITDLPDFALSPQEYITEIGQYLMTLPQHLEMHLSEKQAPWQFLTDVCVHTCNVYAEKILSIKKMDELGTKRCLTDIEYLSSVVEDLGSRTTPSLRSLDASLRSRSP